MYTDLITPAEVVRASFNSLGNAVNDGVEQGAGDPFFDAIQGLCEDVTSDIERYLNRTLIVRPTDFRFDRYPWCAENSRIVDADDNLLHTQYARQWPVVQWISVEGSADNVGEVGIYQTGPGGEVLTWNSTTTGLDDFPTYGVAFAGYRRKDQTIAGGSGSGSGDQELVVLDEDLDTSLEGLTTLPPLLPGVVRRVALSIVVAEARVQLRGVVGLSRQTKRIEQMVVESETLDKDFRMEQMLRLHNMRYIPA